MKTFQALAFLLLAAFLMVLPAFAGPNEDLAVAEQSLRISKETLRQIESDLGTIKADPSADAAVVREFENYAQRSRDAVAQNQARVDALRAAGATVATPAAPAQATPYGQTSAPPPPRYQVAKPKVDMRKEIDQDPLARLDALLGKSIADFDAKLLREMQEVDQARTTGASGIGAAGGEERELAVNGGGQAEGQEGAEGEGEGGEGTGKEGRMAQNGQMGQQGQGKPGEAGGQEGQPGQAGQEGQANQQAGNQQAGNQQPGGTRGSQGASRTGGAAGTPGNQQTRTGGSRGGGTDDDIVARQLREAAERETDPVLKKKLWKEYESYKRGR